jgi:ferritin
VDQSQSERMHKNHLASYITGARILARYNKKNHTAGRRYKKITEYFKSRETKKKNITKDRSELDPGEP